MNSKYSVTVWGHLSCTFQKPTSNYPKEHREISNSYKQEGPDTQSLSHPLSLHLPLDVVFCFGSIPPSHKQIFPMLVASSSYLYSAGTQKARISLFLLNIEKSPGEGSLWAHLWASYCGQSQGTWLLSLAALSSIAWLTGGRSRSSRTWGERQINNRCALQWLFTCSLVVVEALSILDSQGWLCSALRAWHLYALLCVKQNTEHGPPALPTWTDTVLLTRLL